MDEKTSRIALILGAFLAGLVLFFVTILIVTGYAPSPVSQAVAAVGGPFRLDDQNGKAVTDADMKGKPFLVFFGYTHCPDVCPTTMAELSQALQKLGDDGKRVQVLMVTVDPARDTAPLLGEYVSAFSPTFVGLRPADTAGLVKITKDFRVYYAQVPGKTAGEYTMDHTAASYVFDPQGHLRLFARDGQGVDTWVHDLKLLLD